MEYRSFGPTGRDVAVMGQGTWNIGAGDRAQAVAALRRGIERGLTHIDTAEMYGDAEKIVAEAIAGHREDVFLVSKVLPSNASYGGTLEACARSLKRLGTTWLDCYLLHWRGDLPLGATFDAFEQLRKTEKIRSWGVSNFDVPDLEEALRLAGRGRIACNQVLYHLEERAIEHFVLPWCERHGVAVVAYSPLGQGRFPGPRTAGGRVLQEIARAHGATPEQVALRFLARRESVFAIPKASRPAHVEENADAVDLRLTEAEIRRIDEAFPLGPPPKELPTL